MIPSRHNIISKVENTNEYFIVNLLSGNADIISSDTYNEFEKNSFTDPEELIEKGYLVDSEEEERKYRQKYLDFTDNRENDEVQLFFVPWYTCNFACSYCYQDEYSAPQSRLPKEVIDAFFLYIEKTFANRKKYITLFGGEPLLTGEFYKETVL